MSYLYNVVSRKKARLRTLIYTRFFILIQQANKICKIKIVFMYLKTFLCNLVRSRLIKTTCTLIVLITMIDYRFVVRY